LISGEDGLFAGVVDQGELVGVVVIEVLKILQTEVLRGLESRLEFLSMF
jgi:hypothetical protein